MKNLFFFFILLSITFLNPSGGIAYASGPEICGNGIDDDGDGLTDCADPDCYNNTTCYPRFNCPNAAYLFQNSPTDAYTVNLESGTYTLAKDNLIPTDAINGIGYNVKDGYFWGSRSLDRYLARIDANFNVVSFYIPNLPTDNFYVGDVDNNGILYLGKGTNALYKVDLNPASATYLSYLGQLNLTASLNNHDMVFNPNDGFIYSVQKNTNKLIKVNPTTGAVSLYGPIPALNGNTDTYGAIYMSQDGTMYVSNNTTGVIVYVSQVQLINSDANIQSGVFAYGPASSTNDGARCPQAIVLQEVCGNGIDDDGDGLTDCDDPLCGGGTLSLLRTTCATNFLTYSADFNTNGTLTSTSAGTISGNGVSNVPSSTNIVVTATYNGCQTQIEVASPEGCIPPTPVTSGSEGGLESNGSLSAQIAQRSLHRLKNNAANAYNHANLLPLYRQQANNKRDTEIDLENLIPDISLDNATTPHLTTPTDLLSITNAQKILAVDYLDNTNNRIAAVLATQTPQNIYDHTKAICDRLHGATLQSIALVPIEEYSIAQMTIDHPNQQREYALTFSVWRDAEGNWNLENYWAIADYPTHDTYYNFQVWTQSPQYTKQLAEAILQNLKQFGELNHSDTQAQLPSVFIKKGEYQNGKLLLTVQNNSKATNMELTGTAALTETTQRTDWTQSASIDPANTTQYISVNTNNLFDVGFTLTNNKDNRADVLYIADGAWGLDYEQTGANVNRFVIQNSQTNNIPNGQQFNIQRNVSVEAQVQSYLSVFRFLRPSGQAIDISTFNALSFEAQGNDTISVTLVKESVSNFADQPHLSIALDANKKSYTLPFAHFITTNNTSWVANDIKALIFTIKSKNGAVKNITFDIAQVAFKNTDVPNANQLSTTSAVVVPNPFSNTTNIAFYQDSNAKATFYLFDVTGRLMAQQQANYLQGYNSFELQRNNLASGVYFYAITVDNGRNGYTGKIIAW